MSGVFQNIDPTPPAFGAGEDTLAGWRGGGVNILEDARHSSVLYTRKYFVDKATAVRRWKRLCHHQKDDSKRDGANINRHTCKSRDTKSLCQHQANRISKDAGNITSARNSKNTTEGWHKQHVSSNVWMPAIAVTSLKLETRGRYQVVNTL
jgi:hypothetical protein